MRCAFSAAPLECRSISEIGLELSEGRSALSGRFFGECLTPSPATVVVRDDVGG